MAAQPNRPSIPARWTALGVIGALILAACGSTVPGAGSGQSLADASGLSAPDGLGLSSPDAGGLEIDDGLSDNTSGGAGEVPGTSSTGPLSPLAPQAGTTGTADAADAGGTGGPQGAASAEPIEVGLLITDTASFTEATGGVGVSRSNFTRDSVHALIEAINDAGGIAGRKLKVIDHSVEVTSPNLGSEYQAACTKFTQDHHVEAVIYDGVVYHQGFNACLTKAEMPLLHMNGTFGGDVTDLANNPGMIAMNSANIDRRFKSILNKAIGAGFLRSGSKLGIFVENCPYVLRAYARTFVPIVTRAKVSVHREDNPCNQSAADQGQLVTRLQAAALRWKTENVDSVMFLSAFENGFVYYFAQGAEQQDYAPQYLLFQPQGSPAAMEVFPRRQLVRMRGFGGIPLRDVTHPPAPPPVQAAARRTCLSMARRHDVRPSDYLDETVFFNACDAVVLLRQALTISGGQGGTQNLVPAIDRVGTDFISALDLNGATRLGRGRHDGMELTAVSVFKDKCECFEYITRASPIR